MRHVNTMVMRQLMHLPIRALPTSHLMDWSLADAVPLHAVVCFCGYFETPQANEYENANK